MPPFDTRPPTSRPPTSRLPVRLDAGGLSVVFTWSGDRWTHRVTTAGAAEDSGWASLDGPWPPTRDPRWPASPVLVELSRVALPQAAAAGGQAIVGVGLAGRSHFSASIAPDPTVTGAVRFEIACRLHEPPDWLGSTYRVGRQLMQVTATDAGGPLPRTVVWAYSIGPQGIFGVTGASASAVGELPSQPVTDSD